MNEATAIQSGNGAMDRLLELMRRLRAPDGCPWDREQTPVTLKPQLLEECYEVLEAIDSGSPTHLTEELGDLLLHVVFQAQIAQEKGDFDFNDVAQGISEKLVRRHPHVFGQTKAADAGEVVTLWNDLKKAEKPERASALDGVPRQLPALMRAEALQRKARHVGFDWPDTEGALEKVREEVAEVTAEMAQSSAAVAEELGDLLFSVVNLSRHLKLSAEDLLTRANDKFSRRFRAMEASLKGRGRELRDYSLPELDEAWNEVKRNEAASLK
jgi:MazG family protein